MSIEQQLTRLTTARNNIRTALNNKGVAASEHGFEDFASDITAIPQEQDITVEPLTVTENGTYTPEAGKAFGLVTVSVASQGIVEGTETLSFNDHDFVVAVKVYGDTIHYRQFYGGTSVTTFTPFRYLSNIIFADDVKKINANAFAENDGLITLTIPATCKNFEGYVFTNLYKLEELYLLGGGKLGSRCIGQIPTLKACQIGSVGNGLVSFVGGELFFQMTQSELSITIFCIGSLIDDYLSRIRNRATNATIIFKASEDTTYNGENFSAGETILTSVVN